MDPSAVDTFQLRCGELAPRVSRSTRTLEPVVGHSHSEAAEEHSFSESTQSSFEQRLSNASTGDASHKNVGLSR